MNVYAVDPPTTQRYADVQDLANGLFRHLAAYANTIPGFLGGTAPIHIARAPGRLDLLGGIADYSGATVLEVPIAESAIVLAQGRQDGLVRVISLDPEGRTAARRVIFDLAGRGAVVAHSPESARDFLTLAGPDAWALYVVGILSIWKRDDDFTPPHGVDIFVSSLIPEGKGVSSSAAVEIASISALCGVYDRPYDPTTVMFEAQRVENDVVGAPCGIMDQATSMFGESKKLLKISCRPMQILGTVALPDDLMVWGVDSGTRHEIGGGDYGQVRTAAFMGHRILTDALGLKLVTDLSGRSKVADDPWHGHLTEIPAARFDAEFAGLLPVSMSGAEFIDRYGRTIDSATVVDRFKEYPVRAATAHPVHEQARIDEFAAILEANEGSRRARRLGELMYASHASYSACGLGSRGTDRLVELFKQCPPEAGIVGAKITGGGSGGTVAVLGHRRSEEDIFAIARRYAAEKSIRPRIFHGSSNGACHFGVRKFHMR